ncbi:MAG: helix-turn-helix transcriptional regulator, partial [Candidatus Binatia bacterium]
MDRALSDRLRDRLGITEEQSHDTTGVLATPAEMRSLRAMLRLSMKQLGARLGCQAGTISAWERGLRP